MKKYWNKFLNWLIPNRRKKLLIKMIEDSEELRLYDEILNTKGKAEEYNSPLIDQIFESISPKEEKRIQSEMILAAKIEDDMKAITKQQIEEASEYYAHNYFNMHETNSYKELKKGFEAGVEWARKNKE